MEDGEVAVFSTCSLLCEISGKGRVMLTDVFGCDIVKISRAAFLYVGIAVVELPELVSGR